MQQHTCAALGKNKKHNKYKSRQQLEQEYFDEWQAMTTTSQEEKNRPVTVLSFLAFLPIWFKFYVVPGPIRFLWFLIWNALLRLRYELTKQAVIAGVKLDVATLQRRGGSAGYRMRETALRRLHGKESILGPVQLMLKR